MEESNAKRQLRHLFRRDRRRTETLRHLRKWIARQGRNASGSFLEGFAYKLGSGAVTLLILWWETRH
ncbi:hypothetical protein EAO75_34225 [Streptomyces sp. uw30]|uniref:hypothetical protein n=1 Tax=Streptomyces sp. uw30 TaxID=1828179 RepID=UPI0011CDFCFB|nr:hypothetical protein [Streptomyces sp. uw30]TXS41957.1 hypothetical protein EAO75_34225 [Streptomyces sp. uw30]